MSKISFIIFERSYLILKGLRSVIEKVPNTEVVLQSDSPDEVLNFLKNGDADFLIFNPFTTDELLHKKLSKKCKSTQLIVLTEKEKNINYHCIETISIYDTQSSILKKINKVVGNKETQNQKRNYAEDISEREAEIVKYIALGYSNKEIADILFLSTHTVVTHRKNITRKLGIRTVSGLTIYAIINKLIDINETGHLDSHAHK